MTLAGAPPASAAAKPATVVSGLDSPRGLAAGPGNRIYYAEIDGTVTMFRTKGHHAGKKHRLFQVPAGFIAPAIDVTSHGRVFALSNGTLYRWSPRHGVHPVADIVAYQQGDPDPYNLADDPGESNSFGVAALRDGTVLVSDAAGNDLLRVWPDGHIVTVARLKPRIVEVPQGFPATDPEGNPLPPAGTKIPSEAVATSVTVGADGYYYVGELRGFPATPGTSQVWRIKPGSVGAVCDPAAPSTGRCKRYADGFTSIVDLAAGRDGSIYVDELVKASWFAWEALGAEPIGAVYRISPHRGKVTELAAGQLTLPGGVAVSKNGQVYVAYPVFGEGQIVRLAGVGKHGHHH